MAAANDRKACLLQNLQDAMCPEEMTRECIGLSGLPYVSDKKAQKAGRTIRKTEQV